MLYAEFSTQTTLSALEIQAACSADLSVTNVGVLIHFTDMSHGAPTSWTWDFGDESGSSEQNTEHAYSAAGTYAVTLSISDGSQSSNASITISIYASGVIIIPDGGLPGYWIKTDEHYYIIDTVNDRIAIFDTELAYQGYGGGHGVTDGLFDTLSYLAWDGTFIYAVDRGNARVQVLDAGLNYQSQFPIDGIPYGIATNGGCLYVTDTENKQIKIYDMQGNFQSSFGIFQYPTGIACDNNAIYVSDTANNSISAFLFTGQLSALRRGLNTPGDIYLYARALTISEAANTKQTVILTNDFINFFPELAAISAIGFAIEGGDI